LKINRLLPVFVVWARNATGAAAADRRAHPSLARHRISANKEAVMHVLRLLPALPASLLAAAAACAAPAVDWQSWSDSVFERARTENHFVLLDLEAVWCHWCHVMERETTTIPRW